MKPLAASKQSQDKLEQERAARIAAADFLRPDVALVDLRATLARSQSRRARRRAAECALPPAWCLTGARRCRRIYQAGHASRPCAPTCAENPAAPERIRSDDRS